MNDTRISRLARSSGVTGITLSCSRFPFPLTVWFRIAAGVILSRGHDIDAGRSSNRLIGVETTP